MLCCRSSGGMLCLTREGRAARHTGPPRGLGPGHPAGTWVRHARQAPGKRGRGADRRKLVLQVMLGGPADADAVVQAVAVVEAVQVAEAVEWLRQVVQTGWVGLRLWVAAAGGRGAAGHGADWGLPSTAVWCAVVAATCQAGGGRGTGSPGSCQWGGQAARAGCGGDKGGGSCGGGSMGCPCP
ncbi:hypothetical protein HaLaN_17575 [Haematococcus lacustris]|uniref:Uncharacterized protein n=1 Tax=Haematococcus lacustris TaxID=44745 RepID=A0A699ZE85_HAELA|nr:hypothetical protein HaLaN_17575 [Haematococcus lacustris]